MDEKVRENSNQKILSFSGAVTVIDAETSTGLSR